MNRRTSCQQSGSALSFSTIFPKYGVMGISKKCREHPESKADGVPINRDKLRSRSPESFRDEDFEHRPTQQSGCGITFSRCPYIAEDSPNQADKFIDSIDRQFHKPSQLPRIGRSRNELLPGLCSFPVGRYIIFYFIMPDGIEVVRVLHASRDIDEQLNPKQ